MFAFISFAACYVWSCEPPCLDRGSMRVVGGLLMRACAAGLHEALLFRSLYSPEARFCILFFPAAV